MWLVVRERTSFNSVQAGKVELALKKYKLITKWLESDAEFTDAQKTQRTVLQLAGHLNCALCHLKMGNWSEAKEQCNSALEFDSDNAKAYFRRAQVPSISSARCSDDTMYHVIVTYHTCIVYNQAYEGTKDWSEAKRDYSTVLNLDSENKAAKNRLNVCEQKLKQEREKQKKLYSNMFAKLSIPSKVCLLCVYGLPTLLHIWSHIGWWFVGRGGANRKN